MQLATMAHTQPARATDAKPVMITRCFMQHLVVSWMPQDTAPCKEDHSKIYYGHRAYNNIFCNHRTAHFHPSAAGHGQCECGRTKGRDLRPNSFIPKQALP